MKQLYAFLLGLTFFLLGAQQASAANKYDKDYFGETIVHKAVFEDTLIHLARNNSMGFVELRAANPTLDAWIPGAGANIILPKQHILPEAPRNGIVINLAEMRLYYFKEKGQPPITYPLSIGRDGLQTPMGKTSVVRKKDGPTWRPTKRMRDEDPSLPVSVGPGPDNPLGSHALYLGWPQYLIHGTNKPYGVGRRVSSGCMRMYPEDIKEIYPKVPVGTPVKVLDQPVKVGWIGDGLYLEVSPTQDQSVEIEENKPVGSYSMTPADVALINRKAAAHKDKINWEQVREIVKEHRGYPVEILNLKGIVKPKLETVLNEEKQKEDAARKAAQAKAELEAEKAAQAKSLYAQRERVELEQVPEEVAGTVADEVTHPKTTSNFGSRGLNN